MSGGSGESGGCGHAGTVWAHLPCALGLAGAAAWLALQHPQPPACAQVDHLASSGKARKASFAEQLSSSFIEAPNGSDGDSFSRDDADAAASLSRARPKPFQRANTADATASFSPRVLRRSQLLHLF